MVYCPWISARKLMLLVLLLSNQIGSRLAWEAWYHLKCRNIGCVSGWGLSVRADIFCLEVGKHLYYRLQAQWGPNACLLVHYSGLSWHTNGTTIHRSSSRSIDEVCVCTWAHSRPPSYFHLNCNTNPLSTIEDPQPGPSDFLLPYFFSSFLVISFHSISLIKEQDVLSPAKDCDISKQMGKASSLQGSFQAQLQAHHILNQLLRLHGRLACCKHLQLQTTAYCDSMVVAHIPHTPVLSSTIKHSH